MFSKKWSAYVCDKELRVPCLSLSLILITYKLKLIIMLEPKRELKKSEKMTISQLEVKKIALTIKTCHCVSFILGAFLTISLKKN